MITKYANLLRVLLFYLAALPTFGAELLTLGPIADQSSSGAPVTFRLPLHDPDTPLSNFRFITRPLWENLIASITFEIIETNVMVTIKPQSVCGQNSSPITIEVKEIANEANSGTATFNFHLG